MVSTAADSRSSPTAQIQTARKPSRRPAPGKESSLQPNSTSVSSSADKKITSDPNNVSRLGKLPGLSITRSPSPRVSTKVKDEGTQSLAKSPMNDLATQLQVELRKSKEHVRQPKPKKGSSRSTVSSNASSASEDKSRLLKKSSGNPVLASTLSTPQNPIETPAKTSTDPPENANDSPVMMRKRLLEMIAAEKTEEERKRKAKKIKEERRHNNGSKSSTASATLAGSTESISKNTVQNFKAVDVSNQKKGDQPHKETAPPHRSRNDHREKVKPHPVKKEPEDAVVIDTSDHDSRDSGVSNHAPPSTISPYVPPTTVKKEKIDFSGIVNQPPPPTHSESSLPSTNSSSLTPRQLDVLQKQFEIKDYLSRKEMRTVAIKTGLTDTQVRDWFKQKRDEEDIPTIIDEKPAEYQLNHSKYVVKPEPVDAPEDDYGFDKLNREAIEDSIDGVPAVKQEAVTLDEDETGPDSAVLDPLTGKLVKQRRIDKEIENIMSKAPVLESLAKKIESVNKPVNSFKDNFKSKVGNIIDILDDDIMITEENIVNPGPKEKPMSKVINKFLSQVEELEKTIEDNTGSSNFQLLRNNIMKDEQLAEISAEVETQQGEISHLRKELQDKNEEIESILLNSVSKETFVRTQFQSLTTEVQQLRTENKEKKCLEERVKELEKLIKQKKYETEELKERHELTLGNMKELEETSTNMIAEITRGVGEKLSLAKTREKDFALVEEKNLHLVEEVSRLEKQIVQLNGDHFKVREDLSENLKTQAETILQKDEEIGKLKGQVGTLTKRFKDKVKEIQETLSKYNETLKSKNQEITEKSTEISNLKVIEGNQGKLIKMLKESVQKMNNEKEKSKERENDLEAQLQACKNEAEEVKLDLEAKLAEKKTEISGSKLKRRPRSNKKKNMKRKAMEGALVKVKSPEKKLKLEINRDLIKYQEAQFIFPLDMIRLPSFDILEDPILKRQRMVETQRINSYKSHNWPIVPFYKNQLLVDLLEIIGKNN